MAPWLNHPRYRPTRDQLLAKLRSPNYRFRPLQPVIFLCGGGQSPRRERLRQYLDFHVTRPLTFYAEQVWEPLSKSHANALKMEAELARLSDMVLLVIESAGTFAELGAFALHPRTRAKALAIADLQYRTGKSFIETGPLRWLDQGSVFRPTIWTHLDRLLEAAPHIDDRLRRIHPRATTLTALAESPKHLVFFMADLVKILEPTTTPVLSYFLKDIAGRSEAEVATYLEVAHAMQLVRKVPGPSGEYWATASNYAANTAVHWPRADDLLRERASHLSVLEMIPSAVEALEAFAASC